MNWDSVYRRAIDAAEEPEPPARLVGAVTFRFYAGDPDLPGTPGRPPTLGSVVVTYESHDPGATADRLIAWTMDEFTSDEDE